MDQLNQAMALMQCNVQGMSISNTSAALGQLQSGGSTANTLQYVPSNGTSLWDYWQNCYYPQVIYQSYPIYIQQKAMDKGKQAFELLKALMDKGLVKIDKVKDFIEAMDTILKTL